MGNIPDTSNFPLVRLSAKYKQMQKNGRLLSNRASIEVIRHRIEMLADRIDMNEAPDRLGRLAALWQQYQEARKSPAPLERAGAIAIEAKLEAEFEAAATDYAAWKQIMEAIDLDRKLVESEVKIAKDIHAMLSAEDAYELAAKLLGAITSAVNSTAGIPEKARGVFLKRVQWEFAKIVGDKRVVDAEEEEQDEVLDGDITS